MKTLQHILIALLTLVGLCSCTHNDGDIGIWFGTWQVEQIIRDGEKVPDTYYNPAIAPLYFQFQGDMVTVRHTGALHDERVDYGTWVEGEGTLDISFPDSTVAYERILNTFLGGAEIDYSSQPAMPRFHFDITERSSNRVALTYYNAIWNQHYTLYLHKN